MTRFTVPHRTQAVGIVVPVHDEERLLRSALLALDTAAARVAGDLLCHLVVVLDDCRDTSEKVVRRWRRRRTTRSEGRPAPIQSATVVAIDAGSVGSARRAGCAVALHSFEGIAAEHIWLATTDADSTVPEHWLSQQVADHERGVDLWSGSVAVLDWMQWRDGTAAAWGEHYGSERRWAHGASLGVNGRTYLDVGGFEDLASGEDRSLIEAAAGIGARTHYDRSAPVATSARRNGRAPRGFAHALSRIEQDLAPCPTPPRLTPGAGGRCSAPHLRTGLSPSQ